MADPVKKSQGFGDAALAREVLEKAARGEDCREWLDEKMPEVLCDALAFQPIPNSSQADGVNSFEKEGLARAGFSAEFISELAGSDGRRILRERAKWLADRIAPSWPTRNPPIKERVNRVREVGLYGKDAAAALPALVKILRDYLQLDSLNYGEDDLVESAIIALGRIHHNGGNVDGSIEALTAMVENNRPLSVGVAGPKQRILHVAVEILGELGPKAKGALPHLKRMFQIREMTKLPVAVAAIESVENLLKDLNHENLSLRLLACRALEFSGRGDSRVVSALMKTIATDPQIRNDAIVSLTGHGKDAELALPLLAKIYFDANTTDSTRYLIFEVLVALHLDRPETFSMVEDYLNREFNVDTRKRLIGKLLPFGRSAFPTLLKVLKSGMSRDDAAEIIWKIRLTEQDIEPLMEVLDEAYGQNILRVPLGGLKYAVVPIGRPAALPLTRVLKKSEGVSWEMAAGTLMALGKEAGAVAPELYALAREFSEKTNKHERLDPGRAAMYLGKMIRIEWIFSKLGREAVPLLVERSKKERDGDMVRLCLSSLRRMREEAKEAVPDLLRFVENPHSFSYAGKAYFRGVALESLADIAPDNFQVLVKIMEALQDSDRWLHFAATQSLFSLATGGKNPHLYLALPLLMAVRDNAQEEEKTRNLARDTLAAIEAQVL